MCIYKCKKLIWLSRLPLVVLGEKEKFFCEIKIIMWRFESTKGFYGPHWKSITTLLSKCEKIFASFFFLCEKKKFLLSKYSWRDFFSLHIYMPTYNCSILSPKPGSEYEMNLTELYAICFQQTLPSFLYCFCLFSFFSFLSSPF